MKNYHILKSIKVSVLHQLLYERQIDGETLEFLTQLDWSNAITLNLELLELGFNV